MNTNMMKYWEKTIFSSRYASKSLLNQVYIHKTWWKCASDLKR